MNQYRLGIINVPAKEVHEYATIATLLSSIGFVPTKVEHIYHKDVFEMIGMSSHFDLCDQAALPPEYVIGYDMDNDKHYIKKL